jgi:L-ribulokinase
MKKYALGIDYGTNSVRSLIVDLENGAELGSVVFPYPSGELGILTDPADPNVARQNPQDYIDGLIEITTGAIAKARAADPEFDPANIVGMGIDTTGSTIIPVNAEGIPLGLLPEFEGNLAAMVWLWKDHTGHAEAAQITETAAKSRPQYLAKCGGIYSSEWWWSKILRCKNSAPEVFAAAHSWVEHCDFIPALITGNSNPDTMKRGICSAGHKAMYCSEWGGLPDKEFLAELMARSPIFATASTTKQFLPIKKRVISPANGRRNSALNPASRWP